LIETKLRIVATVDSSAAPMNARLKALFNAMIFLLRHYYEKCQSA